MLAAGSDIQAEVGRSRSSILTGPAPRCHSGAAPDVAKLVGLAWERRASVGISGGESPAADDLFYVGGYVCNVLMLPDSEHSPTKGAQMCIRLTIPFDVPSEFVGPPRAVGCGRRIVLGTAVPEAPVDEHRNSGTSKQDVRTSTGQPGKRGVDAVPQTSAVELSPKEHFGLRVTSSLMGHAPGRNGINGRWGNCRDRHGASSCRRLT